MKFKNNIKSIATGLFDGIYLGHQALIRHVEGFLGSGDENMVMKINFYSLPSSETI